jgi:hypothetical protein
MGVDLFNKYKLIRRSIDNGTLNREEKFRLIAFKLRSHIWDLKRGPFFTGVYLPQKSILLPPIETQYVSVQKHVSSYKVKRSPGCFIWAAPTLLTGAIVKNWPYTF